MNRKQATTLQHIFENPIRADIDWKDVESLLIALGAELSEGNGSRIRIKLNNERAVFHRPHPERVTDKGAVKALRLFLINAGVRT